MDITTLLGIVSLAGLLWLGVASGNIASTFLNWHGIGIVAGGTGIAMLINTPLENLASAVFAIGRLLGGGGRRDKARAFTALMELAEQHHRRGVSALADADPKAAGGFLALAAQTAADHNDPDLVEQILHNEINRASDRNNEITNVYRTAAVLAPMFGLLGTLLGIVGVLREISNPEQVGGAMAVAVTTAFYGISFSNVLCIPIAGKLRLRYLQETEVRAMAADGVVLMLRGAVPLVIERKLKSYL